MALYLKHFGLKREPFSIVPDPGFLYPSNQHRQAVAHLKYGLDREGGFILLTGEVGTGKTTLTRTLLKAMPAHIRVAYVLNSKLEVGDLLASICHELGVDLAEIRGLSFAKECVDALYHDLLQVHAEGKKTLVVIEEGQNLSADVLETLRLLSNLETHTEKLLHILLVGQPELLETLAQRELRQLNQRVVARFHLQPLERDDLANYINHRLHRAGAQRPIFDSDCTAVLYRLTEGVPRLINLVCQHSLLAAYATGSATVSGRLLKRAAREILPPPSAPSKSSGRRRIALSIGLLLLGVVAGLGLAVGAPDFNAGLQRVQSLSAAETPVLTEARPFATEARPLVTEARPLAGPGTNSGQTIAGPSSAREITAAKTAAIKTTAPTTAPERIAATNGDINREPNEAINEDINKELSAAPNRWSPSREPRASVALEVNPQGLPKASLAGAAVDPLPAAQVADTTPVDLELVSLRAVTPVILSARSSPDQPPEERTSRPQPGTLTTATMGGELIAPPLGEVSFAADMALLKLWLAPASRASQQSFEVAIKAARLRIESRDDLDLERLLALNRPGIVDLQRPSGRERLLLRGASEKMLSLQGRRGLEYISHDAFTQAWSGGYRYLWKPPEGYSVLQKGLANRQFIDWLQARMSRLDQDYEWVISGGRYGDAIRAKVTAFQQRHRLRADGVLGQQTTMMINSLTDPSVPLLRSKDD
jgi:type II secretory pathway predicted ATPase ExeA